MSQLALDTLRLAKSVLGIRKLRLKTVMEQSQKTRKKQDRSKDRYVSQVGPWLQRLLRPDSKALKIAGEVKKEFPGRNSGGVLTKRKNRWVKKAKLVTSIIEFTEYIGGPNRMYGSALYIVRDIALHLMRLAEGKQKAQKMANQWFIEKSIGSRAEVFEKSGYEAEFLDFLPPNISFKLGPTREVMEIVETFGREKKNWQTIAYKLAFIAENFNSIVRSVKRDIRSGDEVTRLCALMMAIIIETGLRPGEVGNRVNVKDPATGEDIPIETFGVTTLQPRHVKFIRNNFVELRFVGKAGTENVANLSDQDILKALQEVLDTSTLNGDTSMLFVTKDGQHVGYKKLKNYAMEKWGDITPTDFRKLRATQTFYDSLKQKVAVMQQDLQGAITAGTGKIKDVVVSRVLQVLKEAAVEAQEKLSHKDWQTTVKTYVDPRVVVNFLNRGGLNDALEDILVHGRNVALTFDFEAFLSQVKKASPVVIFRELNQSIEDPSEVMMEMEDMIGNLG